MKTIIKGAIYTDADTLLRPHFSGNFYIVDCTEYKKEEVILSEYSESTANEFINESRCLTYEGTRYFECQYSPCDTKDMELLSEINSLEYFDNETEF